MKRCYESGISPLQAAYLVARALGWHSVSAAPFAHSETRSAQALTASAVFAVQHQFFRTRQATVQACAAFDYVLSPVAPITAFNAQLAAPTNDPLRPLEHIAFTVPFNMSEQPAVRHVQPGPAHRPANCRCPL